MCGILFSLTSANNRYSQSLWNKLEELNTKRGPDSQQLRTLECLSYKLQFFSSVLHLRGPNTVSQPIYNPNTEDILCWNGEVFSGLNIPFGANDTEIVMKELEKSNTPDNETEAYKIILNTMSKIEGPYAFVFWQAKYKTLWFSRDCLGRRSLLWHQSEGGSLIISSVGLKTEELQLEELSANGIYNIKINDSGTISQPKLYPWKHSNEGIEHSLILPFPKLNTQLPKDDQLAKLNTENEVPEINQAMEQTIQQFIDVLGEAVRRRVADVPYLNSHETSPRIAILFSGGLDCICLAALVHQLIPITETIDLLNVAFENPRSEMAKEQNKKKNSNSKATSSNSKSTYDTPDRVTGKASVAELRTMAPDRHWNFVEINVPYEEAMNHKQEIIDRMYPLDTVMDLSIAMALWFASRGRGTVDGKEYESYARVLISGLGADEQLGGYSRHREAYKRGEWKELIQETQLDIDRISTRNLGRDDRIMSDHGKEVRFPFLDTDVVNFLCLQPIYLKMDMRFDRGIGEKILLRHVARQLNLPIASKNWKRAIQFGAKTARMTQESRSQKGQHKLE
ncbi:unnamed protein product [Cunninghamella echinulata]